MDCAITVHRETLKNLIILAWHSAEMPNKLRMAHNVHSGGQAVCPLESQLLVCYISLTLTNDAV